ncbi:MULTISPECIES: cation diffusion facilitator family transporter [unclassified Streptomyces]|uniref:cation diffusion facilitator family transporter n=1 Tax=unclassified Streptomyces TaxID=2593676 RepID=UPI0011A38EFE|nr:cation diffusion facilitator family transporter [Streptomyces sp. BK340]TVZ79026.1 cation diffusion facilitator family transporter [Streptomyces sp. BK340]
MTRTEGHRDRGSTARDVRTRVTVLVALAANLVIAAAKAAAGLFAGSPALLSEAAHSVADSLNEVFLLIAVRRSRRPPDDRHPFGYGKERYFWALLAAVGIFVMGGCFSVYQGVQALRMDRQESLQGYLAGLAVLGVALLAEGGSLVRALYQARRHREGAADPALRTVIAEDATAVAGVLVAAGGISLHLATGQVVWEAGASMGIGLLLVCVAYRLAREARDQLIGEAVDTELRDRIADFLGSQDEIDRVAALLTMRLGLDSVLVAARVDLAPGLDSEEVELVCVRIKRRISGEWPQAEHVFLDITEAPGPGEGRPSSAVAAAPVVGGRLSRVLGGGGASPGP